MRMVIHFSVILTSHRYLITYGTWPSMRKPCLCTQIHLLYYFNYLTFCVSYTSSVNCIWFQIVHCTIRKSCIDKLCLEKKLLKFKSNKFCVHISTVFSCRVMTGLRKPVLSTCKIWPNFENLNCNSISIKLHTCYQRDKDIVLIV